jgi:hypothetical protein
MHIFSLFITFPFCDRFSILSRRRMNNEVAYDYTELSIKADQ